jgi:hypothetical protein
MSHLAMLFGLALHTVTCLVYKVGCLLCLADCSVTCSGAGVTQFLLAGVCQALRPDAGFVLKVHQECVEPLLSVLRCW